MGFRGGGRGVEGGGVAGLRNFENWRVLKTLRGGYRAIGPGRRLA